MTTLYIATAFYNGCVVSDSTIVTVLPLPCYAGNDTLICEGQPLALQGNVLTGTATYLWSPAASVSSTNTAQTNFIANQSTSLYYKVSRNGCVNTDTLNISVNPLTTANFSYANNLLNVNYSNTSSYYDSLYWDFGDGSALNFSANPSHVYAQNGIYTTCLHTFNSCGSDSVCKVINLSTVGMNEIDVTFSLIKNSSGFQLRDSKSIDSYALYDFSGRCLFQSKEANNLLNLDFSNYQSGCYLLRYQQNSTSKSLKLMW